MGKTHKKTQKLSGINILAPHILIVNCVSFLRDNYLQLFVVVFNKYPTLFLMSPGQLILGKSLKSLQT